MQPEQGISIKAIALGIVADVVVTMVLGIGLGVLMGIVLVAQGVPPNEMAAQMQGPFVLVPSLVVGLMATALGGYVAGWVAGRSEVLHGAAVGLGGSLLGLLFIASMPLWYNITSFVSVIPFAMLGGWLAARRNTSSRNSSRGSKQDLTETDAEQW